MSALDQLTSIMSIASRHTSSQNDFLANHSKYPPKNFSGEFGVPGDFRSPLHPVLRLFHTVDGLSMGYGKNFCNFSGNFPKNSPLDCTVFQYKSRRQILCCLPPPRYSLSISFDNSQIFSIIVWESFCLKNDVLPGFSPRRNGLFRPVSGAVPPPGTPLPPLSAAAPQRIGTGPIV